MTLHEVRALGERLATCRRACGVTQRELAAAAHVSETWLSQVEWGVRPTPRPALLARVAEALGVSAHDLIHDGPTVATLRQRAGL
jgi:transcriptional regulator with XRE-family HTH domain